MELIELKDKICAALLAQGISMIQVDYSGSGDSGDVSDIRGYAANGDEIDNTYSLLRNASAIQSDLKYINNLHEEISRFADDVISEAGYDGYENNDGGEGTVTIHVDSKRVTIQHNWMILTTQSEEEMFVLSGEEK